MVYVASLTVSVGPQYSKMYRCRDISIDRSSLLMHIILQRTIAKY